MHIRASRGAMPPERRPVILVHGMVVASSYMVPLAERLAPDFPVYVPDLPGYGDSDKPDRTLSLVELADAISGFMDAARLARSALIGNSFGCQILAEFAVRWPARVDRLVLQGPTVDPSGRTFPEQLKRLWQNSRRERGAMAQISRQDYRKAGLRRAWKTLRLALGDRIEDKLPKIEVPTLVLVGSDDPLVPLAWAERAANLLPLGRLVVVPGVTHTMNYVAPDVFVRAIRPFLLEGRNS
jgi:2-hydroxy-6-oxonona-2,4-dienedioate hydrolase